MEAARQLAGQASKVGMRMLQHTNQALAAIDPQLVMAHVREAMEEGEEITNLIDQVLEYSSEGTAIREKTQAAEEHLLQAMTEGGAALTASESFIKARVQAMKEHLNEMMTNLNAAVLPVGR